MEYSIKHSVLDWRPDIDYLSETLLLGPQAEILEKVEMINNSFHLDLRVTKTYRWSPGYMDKIKEWMAKGFLEPHMKRKISTYFNKIDEKSWRYSRFKTLLNELDDKMASRRANGAIFQDNTDILRERLDIFSDRITSQLELANNQYSDNTGLRISAGMYTNDINEDETFMIKMVLPASKMNIFVGNTAYLVDIDSCVLYFPMDLKALVYGICNNRSEINEDTFNLNSIPRRNGLSTAIGKYYPNWDCNNDAYTLTHPYISNNNYNYKVVDDQLVSHVCLGDLTGSVESSLRSMDMLSLCATMMIWHTTFHVGRTHPLNSIGQLFFGLPEGCNTEEFKNALSIVDDASCRHNYPENEHWSTDYCDYIGCELRKECNLYMNGGFVDEPCEDDMEVEGEIVHRDGEPDVDEGYRRIAEERNNETPEERVIRWASEHGGAINIGGGQ